MERHNLHLRGGHYMETPTTNKLKECDLVMKGGVTSGIVYPPAVIKLSEEYRFRAIGGTSAGAIAAAATAAAEHGREREGFVKLDGIRKKLSEGGFLEGLFQPSGETRPLLDTLKALQRASADAKAAGVKRKGFGVIQKARMLHQALRRNDAKAYRKGALVGGLIGGGLALALVSLAFLVLRLTGGQINLTGLLTLFVVAALPLCLSGCLLGGIVGSSRHLYHILTVKAPENFFGLCSGRGGGASDAQQETLTDWLSLQVDDLAGIADEQRPLTFGRLMQKDIRLRMMTSNLSQNQPYVIPFENNRFIFNRDEFARLFPEYILEHLVKKAYQSGRVALPPGYYFLPASEDLPVAVALRLSLSFPLLISAVPLYTISLSAFARSRRGEKLRLTEEDLMLNWFSDGGISSNFPIQFFDAWLPVRPTFGIKLEALPPEALRDGGGRRRLVEPEYISVVARDGDGDQGQEEAGLQAAAAPADGRDDDDLRDAVYLPKANAPLVAKWTPLTKEPTPTGKGAPLSLTKFVWSIFETAQNYRDNMQSALSSYRERIVQIRLRDDEGGLNLMMPGEVIDNVIKKGLLAGETLLTHFNFEHHQWVRFRVLMAQLEDNLMGMQEVLRDNNLYFDLEKLMSDQLNKENRYPYARDEAWCKDALERVKRLREVVGEWERPVFGQGVPRPEPALRITPEI
jgi:predicted acylesterase/phospholipase RssA